MERREFIKICAAGAAIQQSMDFVIKMEDLEQWVHENGSRWPQAGEWLAQAWSLPLNHWEGENYEQLREYEADRRNARLRRQKDEITEGGFGADAAFGTCAGTRSGLVTTSGTGASDV